MSVFLSSGPHRDRVFSLIGLLSEKLMVRNMLLGTAESCTGGLIAALCTEVPGSSRWFAGGVVSYGNSVKSGLLGVDPALLAAHGAVSGPVVEAMAKGALDALGVDASLAVSGVAGPEGGSADKPVGTVWIAAGLRFARAGENGESSAGRAGNGLSARIAARRHLFSGNRSEVRFAAALAALEGVAELL